MDLRFAKWEVRLPLMNAARSRMRRHNTRSWEREGKVLDNMLTRLCRTASRARQRIWPAQTSRLWRSRLVSSSRRRWTTVWWRQGGRLDEGCTKRRYRHCACLHRSARYVVRQVAFMSASMCI